MKEKYFGAEYKKQLIDQMHEQFLKDVNVENHIREDIGERI